MKYALTVLSVVFLLASCKKEDTTQQEQLVYETLKYHVKTGSPITYIGSGYKLIAPGATPTLHDEVDVQLSFGGGYEKWGTFTAIKGHDMYLVAKSTFETWSKSTFLMEIYSDTTLIESCSAGQYYVEPYRTELSLACGGLAP